MENSHPELIRRWSICKHILCIRADNMGDLLMSTPAIAALKEWIGCKITVLTSVKGAAIAKLIPDIDQVIIADLQWVKAGADPGPEQLEKLTALLKRQNFDGCVIFNVYSQNPLPSALIAYMADIPLRLAYCRENPYYLLTNWVPDPEPYFYISHQVERDLDLVRMIGAVTEDRSLRLELNTESLDNAWKKLAGKGISLAKPYIILHPGVSEDKRKYPEELWVSAGKLLAAEFGIQLLLTGSVEEEPLSLRIANGIGVSAFSVAGLLDLEEFAGLISGATTMVSVNTGTVHIAAALKKPLVVLYAQTNPQHTPWMVRHRLLEYSIEGDKKSQNQVIRYVNGQYYAAEIPFPSARAIAEAVRVILNDHQVI